MFCSCIMESHLSLNVNESNGNRGRTIPDQSPIQSPFSRAQSLQSPHPSEFQVTSELEQFPMPIQKGIAMLCCHPLNLHPLSPIHIHNGLEQSFDDSVPSISDSFPPSTFRANLSLYHRKRRWSSSPTRRLGTPSKPDERVKGMLIERIDRRQSDRKTA